MTAPSEWRPHVDVYPPGVSNDIENRNGVEWFNAPRPRRWHRCRPQTRGYVGVSYIERCACGAIRRVDEGGEGPWMERNSRRSAQ